MHVKTNVIALLFILLCNGSLSYVSTGDLKHWSLHHSTIIQRGSGLIVQTNKGKVIGKHDQTEFGTKYLAFQGVPYAKPPVNDLRFELPQEYAWDGIWNATFERNECVQAFPGFLLPVRGREDCLYVNIYTKKLGNSNNLKPVMVWIYGGSYLYGSGNKDIYSPDFFMEKDMVVVTLNYRLGVFGFLSTGDDILPGNNGLKDQIFALKWIQENIAFFGGDPQKVTIMGESAGGAAVGHLIQSDSAKGLFHQGILQSNSIIGIVSPEKMRKGLLMLGSAFGVTSGNSRDIIDKLRTVDYESLLLYSVVITDATKQAIFDSRLFAPVLEDESPSAVITKHPFEQLKECKFNSVPVVLGFNSEESLTYMKDLNDQRYTYITFDQNPENLVPTDLKVKGQCNSKDIGRKIKEHYVGKKGGFVSSPNGILRYVSDTYFMILAIEYVKLYSNCNENTYLYWFSYNGGKNTTGAGHAEELRYLFATFPVITQREPFSATEKKVSRNMVDLWSNFMTSGNPTPTPNKFGVTWHKSVASSNYEYIDIGKKLTVGNMKNAPFRNDWEFWDNLYKTCGRSEDA